MYVCYVCIWVCAVVDVCESKGGGSAGKISVLYLYIEAACNRYNPTWNSCMVWTGIVHRIRR